MKRRRVKTLESMGCSKGGGKTQTGLLVMTVAPAARPPPEMTSLQWRVRTKRQGRRRTARDGDD